MEERGLITFAEAASLTGQSASEIITLACTGALQMFRVNGQLYVASGQLMALPFSQGGMGAERHRDEAGTVGFTVLAPAGNPSKELAGLTRYIAKQINAHEDRKRQRGKVDEAYFNASLLAFVDAISTVALVRVQPHGGLNVAFSDSKYTGSQISSTQLRIIRRGMVKLGLIEVGGHFYDSNGQRKSYSTRIRPTQAFRELVNQYGVELPPLAMSIPAYAISKAADDVGNAPEDVVALDAVVRRYNEFTQQFQLTLPDDAWAELEAFMIAADETGNTTNLHKGYDERRIFLIRLFTETWERGGRLYGGYWQGMPKAFRAQLLIGGQPTVELDYSRLHPRMLYNREGMAFGADFDPYTVPGFDVPTEVAKETFNRLLNSDRKIVCRKEDKAHFSDKHAFNAYRDAMIEHLQPVAHKFQNDEGAQLQKVDSELALNVIARCMDEVIAVYPVHDSFIVTKDNEDRLRNIMLEEYEDMMGYECKVK